MIPNSFWPSCLTNEERATWMTANGQTFKITFNSQWDVIILTNTHTHTAYLVHCDEEHDQKILPFLPTAHQRPLTSAQSKHASIIIIIIIISDSSLIGHSGIPHSSVYPIGTPELCRR